MKATCSIEIQVEFQRIIFCDIEEFLDDTKQNFLTLIFISVMNIKLFVLVFRLAVYVLVFVSRTSAPRFTSC
jgi:hypothetical protein